MNLSIALSSDSLPESEEPLPEKRKQPFNRPMAARERQQHFAYLYQHERPFRPDWADQKPGSTPKLPLKPPGPPGGRP